MSDQEVAVLKSDIPEFIDLDNQMLVEAFGYSLIPDICIACQNLNKPQGKHFKCLASQDGDAVSTAYETSEHETPLTDICSGFRSRLPTNVVYDSSGNRRCDPNTLGDRINLHTPPPGVS